MSYADQSMSGSRITALIIVALIHVVLGYALVTGLAYEAAKKVIQKVTTVDIKEEVKKEEPPPPPPKKADIPPPPVVVPPPKIAVNVAPPRIETVQTAPPPPPPVLVIPPPVAAPPPPPPPKPASPRGDPQSWVTSNDYPSRALREERQGTTGFRVTISEDGRVESCSITSSSGSADLDEATCANITRRARFRKPSEGYGSTYSSRIRWVVPK